MTSPVAVSDKVVLDLITPIDSSASDAERLSALERYAINERKERLAAERQYHDGLADAHRRISTAEEYVATLRADHEAAQKVSAVGAADLQVVALYLVMAGTISSAVGGLLNSL